MPHLSKEALDPEYLAKLFSELELLIASTTKRDSSAVLQALLTETERKINNPCMILKVNLCLIVQPLRIKKRHEKIHKFLQSISIVDETDFHLNPLRISIDARCEYLDNLTSLF